MKTPTNTKATSQGEETKTEKRIPGHVATLQQFARLIRNMKTFPYLTEFSKKDLTQTYNQALRNYIEATNAEDYVPISEDTKKS